MFSYLLSTYINDKVTFRKVYNVKNLYNSLLNSKVERKVNNNDLKEKETNMYHSYQLIYSQNAIIPAHERIHIVFLLFLKMIPTLFSYFLWLQWSFRLLPSLQMVTMISQVYQDQASMHPHIHQRPKDPYMTLYIDKHFH